MDWLMTTQTQQVVAQKIVIIFSLGDSRRGVALNRQLRYC